jgi:hypothetical protein
MMNFYLTGSTVFQCIEYHLSTEVRQKTFTVLVFQSVSPANIANMINISVPPLGNNHSAGQEIPCDEQDNVTDRSECALTAKAHSGNFPKRTE